MSAIRLGGIRFYPDELRDLAVAWVALGIAFTLFIFDPPISPELGPTLTSPEFVQVLLISMLTVGVGFLLHELAHKVVAVRFGQMAAFRAEYGMLALAIGAALAGFLFAAPGAVYHRGRITERQNGLVAIAGPLTNVALVVVFLPFLLFDGFLGGVGEFGVVINAFLAAFNMIPFGPLDGRKVRDWDLRIFAVAFVGTVALGVLALYVIGFPSV
ncbi:metalloprotease [Natronomonas marina]|uniref:metalloprotease n=1 Tax=Natronomonas marina TaxID=2961939 RepID=UPI0020C9FFDA|nr:metalloprotease [Natronomonas marina]